LIVLSSPLTDPSSETTAKPRLLVVDDDVEIVAELSEMLRAAKYEVVTANDPNEARRLILEDEAIGVIISDLRMPRQDGIEMIESLGDIPELVNRPLRFIIITGHGTLVEAQRSLRVQATDFLTKPLSPKDLLGAIERAIASIQVQAANQGRTRAMIAETETLRRCALSAAAKTIALEARLDQVRVATHQDLTLNLYRRLAELYATLLSPADHQTQSRPESVGGDWRLTVQQSWAVVAPALALGFTWPAAQTHPSHPVPPDVLLAATEGLAIYFKLQGGETVRVEAHDDPHCLHVLSDISPEFHAQRGLQVDLAIDAALLVATRCLDSLGYSLSECAFVDNRSEFILSKYSVEPSQPVLPGQS